MVFRWNDFRQPLELDNSIIAFKPGSHMSPTVGDGPYRSSQRNEVFCNFVEISFLAGHKQYVHCQVYKA